MALIIDPPMGWMYGFPAKWDKEKYPTYRELLLAHDYPVQDIEFAEKYSRWWEEETEEEKRLNTIGQNGNIGYIDEDISN